MCACRIGRPAERMILVTATPFDSFGRLQWDKKDVLCRTNCDEVDVNWCDNAPHVEDYVPLKVSLRPPPEPVVTDELMDAAEEFLSDLWQELQGGGGLATIHKTDA